ncbi:type VI secretion system-associated lipoprotein [Pseudomonas sp. FSL W5-0203]|nr:type VI secretion system-associated lipoprotein [Pseudomonas sp. FSL W5-0203]
MFSNLRLCTLLLACLALGGCTMLGKIGQVIWTPSIPVGGPDDQPSRYSLSLHASDNVNPRLISTGTAPVEDENRSPYTLNVQAASPQALTDKVQTLLNHLYETVPAQSLLTVEPTPAEQMSPIEDALLGAYDAQGVSLTTPWGSPALEHVATPIAFKVLQLTDDSLLVNTSPEALAEDLKKTLGSTYIRADDYLLQPGQFKFIDLRALDEDTRFIAVIANYHSSDVGQWKQRLRVEPKGRQYAVLVQLDATQVSLKGETR